MGNKDNDEWKDFKSPWYPFYYNPKDKRIIVPKLLGIGWTFNFGHRGSWIIMFALVVLLPLVVILFLLLIRK
jgi:uncharacterized membrane protein